MTDFLKALGDQGLLSPSSVEEATADTSFGEDGYWHDADTIKKGGESYRLVGYNAREVHNPAKGTPSQVGGLAQKNALAGLARSKGFTNLVPNGEYDVHGRPLADLEDARGNKWSEEVNASGLIDPNAYEQGDSTRRNFGHLAKLARQAAGGKGNEWDAAADFIDEAINEQTVTGGWLKGVAHNEAELSRNPNYFLSDTVSFRSKDRTLNNKSLNPMSDAWEAGLRGVAEGAGGFAELIGNRIGADELENWGEALKEDQQYKIGSLPHFITDYKEVDDIGSAVEYVGNLAAMSLPYMAITIGGAALAPATGGLSLSAPAAVYSGQVWNEMGDTDEGEKSASLAIGAGIGMAVLDRLGLAGIANAGLLSKAGRTEIVKAYAKKEGIPEELAAQQVHHFTRLESAKLMADASAFAKQQITAGNTAKSFLQSALVGSTTEGLTEVGQEALAAIAAYKGGNQNKDWDWNDFNDRLIQAAVGGGVLGGAFTLPGTAVDAGKWADVAYRTAPANAELVAEQNLWAEAEAEQHGRVRSHDELVETATANATKRKRPAERIGDRATRAPVGEWYKTFDGLLEAAPGLWRGATRHIFKENLQKNSDALRQLSSLFGGNLFNTFNGASFETHKHLKLAEYRNLVDTPSNIAASFGKTASATDLKEVSGIVYGAYNQATKRPDGSIDWDSLTGTDYEQHIDALKRFDRNTRRMTDKLYEDQVAYNPDLGYVKDYAFKARSLDKVSIEKNKQGFIKDLQRFFKMSHTEARDLTQQILDIDSISDLDEAFSVVEKGGFKPTAHKSRTLNMSENPEFAAAWLDPNVFNNISNVAKSAARFESYSKFVGPDNQVLNELLDQGQQELIDNGMPAEQAQKEIDKIARGMQDYLDAESGNYKRPTTSFGRGAQAIQKNLMMYTALIGLPLATISSFVEFAMIYRNIDRPRLKELSGIALTEAKEMSKNMIDTAATTESAGRRELQDLGFFNWEVGAATVTGVSDIKHSQRFMMDQFFKFIGLTQWTDYTRAVRASFAADYMAEKLETYANADLNALTNEDVEARDALRNLGVDVEGMVEMYDGLKTRQATEEDSAFIQDQLRTGTFNFINDAIVLPQSANRPLLYQDPRFKLFTQFHGFISTFQANHLPKMYRQLFKGQTPSIKYNAFAVMATMIMLGFLSQYLKDLLKYGKGTEYLDTPEKIQRAVGASGLMGITERGLNLVNPLYESRYDNSIEWAADTILGESAALSTGQRLSDAAGSVFDGNARRTAHKLSKLTPLVGPVGPRLVDIAWEE